MSGHLDGPPPGPPDPPYIPGDLGAPSAEEFARRRRAAGHEQRIAALDDLVQRAWKLIAGAMSGNPHKPTANSEWMDAAHAWEIDYCMGAALSGKTSDEKTEPEPHESERIAELAAREAEPNPYRSQDQIVRDEERTRILALLDSVEAEEAVVNALMAAVDAGADLGSEARAAITALVGLVERVVPNG